MVITLNRTHIGVGPTAELSLRVSVATLSRVVFPHPDSGITLLALEHKATLIPNCDPGRVEVKAQPFGGAIRIINPQRLLAQVSSFNFDSQRSQAESDFRVYIQPSTWSALRDFCLDNMGLPGSLVLESDPSRELVEEFNDTLGIHLGPQQYAVTAVDMVVENESAPTANINAIGKLTTRIYQVYEVQILDPRLRAMMIANCVSHPGQVLNQLALAESKGGRQGRANGIFVAPVADIRTAYLARPADERGLPMPFGDTHLAGNVAAVLEDVTVSKYLHYRK